MPPPAVAIQTVSRPYDMAGAPPDIPGVRHRFVDAGGLRMHLAEAGPADGEPVVCLHGWPQDWLLWRRVMPALAADGHRVIAPDLRGFGWSDAPPDGYGKEQLASDVLALVDALGIARFALLGHDWGGWVALLLALRAPARVRRVLALSIASPLGGPPLRRVARHLHRLAYQLVLATPVLGQRLLAHHPRRLRALLQRSLRGAAEPALVDGWVARLTEPARARSSVLLYRTSLVDELPAIARGRYRGRRYQVPVQLVVGREDPVVRPALLEGVEAQGDAVRVEEVAGVGHFVVDEAPALVIDRARSFFV